MTAGCFPFRTFMRVLHFEQSGASVSRRDLGFSCDTIGGVPEP
jgi:hypothetical protein